MIHFLKKPNSEWPPEPLKLANTKSFNSYRSTEKELKFIMVVGENPPQHTSIKRNGYDLCIESLWIN